MDYEAATKKAKQDEDWRVAEANYKKIYGASWTNLSTEDKAKIEAAVRSGNKKKIDSAIKSSALYTEEQRNKKQFKVEK